MKPKKIRPADVAPLLGISAQAVRVKMRRGQLPIGMVYKHPNSGIYDYDISPKMFYEYTGIKLNGYEPPPVTNIGGAKELAEVLKKLLEEVN